MQLYSLYNILLISEQKALIFSVQKICPFGAVIFGQRYYTHVKERNRERVRNETVARLCKASCQWGGVRIWVCTLMRMDKDEQNWKP